MVAGNDKKTIGITPSGKRILSDLMKTEQFSTEIDAAKFALAVAVKRGAALGAAEGADTKWNIGTVDPDQSLRLIIESLYQDVTEPYRVIESLIDQGLNFVDAGPGIPPDLHTFLFDSRHPTAT